MSNPEIIQIDDGATVLGDSPVHGVEDVMEVPSQPVDESQHRRFDSSQPGNWLQGRVATILVGKEKMRCSIHERLLSARSPFFARTISEAPRDQDFLEIHLDNVDPKLFEMVLRWLYATAFAGDGGIRIFRYSPPDERITISDYLALYVLAQQLEIVGVKNAAIDVIYNYFGDTNGELRVPNLNDVNFVFGSTPPDSHLRRLLIAHTLFYMFDKRRVGKPLPDEWEPVMRDNGEIAWTLIRMLADWSWVMGGNVPPMKIRSRQSFHEPIPIDCAIIKKEDADEEVSQNMLSAQLGVSVNPQPQAISSPTNLSQHGSPQVSSPQAVMRGSRGGSPKHSGLLHGLTSQYPNQSTQVASSQYGSSQYNGL